MYREAYRVRGRAADLLPLPQCPTFIQFACRWVKAALDGVVRQLY